MASATKQGNPLAIVSNVTLPNVSVCEGKKKISLLA